MMQIKIRYTFSKSYVQWLSVTHAHSKGTDSGKGQLNTAQLLA